MTKTELVKKIKNETELTTSQVETVINAALDTIIEAVANGDKVQFIGFGTFDKRKHGERSGRNPRTGESIIIEARKVPHFTAGEIFKKAVNS